MKRLLLFLFFTSAVFAQQPQAPANTPVVDVNAKFSQGIGTGYTPTKGSGLTLNLGGGTVVCSGTTPIFYAAGTLTMTNSTTNYVYLNTTSSCAPSSNTSGFTTSTIPIAIVATSGGNIVTITDVRSPFNAAPNNGSGPPFIGPNPWFDVTNAAYAGGAKCDGVTDDSAAFQAAINAQVAYGGGTVFIPPTTGAGSCFIHHTLLVTDNGYWLNILQAGNITADVAIMDSSLNPIIDGFHVTNHMFWLGVPANTSGLACSFCEPSSTQITETANVPAFHLASDQVRMENLSVSSSATTAHGINFYTTTDGGGQGGANITLKNTSVFMAGTGTPLYFDGSVANSVAANGGFFSIAVLGGVFGAQATAVNHASIYIRDAGFIMIGDPDRRGQLGGYGIVIQDDGSNSGSGLAHIQNFLSEAMNGALVTAKNVTGAGGTGGINNITMDRMDVADCSSTCYMFSATSNNSNTTKGVDISNSSGATLLDPANNHLNGVWSKNNFEVSDTASLPTGIDVTVQEPAGGLQLFGQSATHTVLATRGSTCLGCLTTNALSTNDISLHVADNQNASNGILLSSLPNSGNGATIREDSTSSAAFHTFESPNGGAYNLYFGTPAAGFLGALGYDHSDDVFTLNANGHRARVWGTSVGNFTAGDFTAPIRLGLNGDGNPGFFAASLSSVRVWTMPDATGTVCLSTAVCAGSGSTTIASGTIALGTGAISSGTCATAVTATATGTANTDVVRVSFNGDPTGVIGYQPLTSGILTIFPWPSTNTLNVKVCNMTSSSITPGAVTLNWQVIR